jgi:hypothetical protein
VARLQHYPCELSILDLALADLQNLHSNVHRPLLRAAGARDDSCYAGFKTRQK